MKFKIEVEQDNRRWWEEYDEETDDAQKWGEYIVEWFNATAQPGASTRYLITVELL